MGAINPKVVIVWLADNGEPAMAKQLNAYIGEKGAELRALQERMEAQQKMLKKREEQLAWAVGVMGQGKQNGLFALFNEAGEFVDFLHNNQAASASIVVPARLAALLKETTNDKCVHQWVYLDEQPRRICGKCGKWEGDTTGGGKGEDDIKNEDPWSYA